MTTTTTKTTTTKTTVTTPTATGRTGNDVPLDGEADEDWLLSPGIHANRHHRMTG